MILRYLHENKILYNIMLLNNSLIMDTFFQFFLELCFTYQNCIYKIFLYKLKTQLQDTAKSGN